MFDIASDRKEDLLFNIWRMGMNAIERGNRDTWTHYPRRVIAAEEALERRPNTGNQQGGRGGGGARAGREEFIDLLRDPAMRDPRGYILSADQPDFPTAAKFMEALLETGVAVHRATSDFQVAGKTYPAGSFVVKTAQAFRPHVLDMFEPQDHPDDIPFPGGPPTPPYDNAGWTLAYQMGVEFDRILEGFDGPFEPIPTADVQVTGRIAGSGNAGFVLSHQQNDAFVAVNRLLAAGRDVFWLEQPFQGNGKTYPAGTFFVPASGNARQILERTVQDRGIAVEAVSARPSGEALELQPVRIALWDRYGGSMPSGWTRWIMEQFEFPFEVVYPQQLDAGDLNDKYDVLVFVDGAIPEPRPAGGRRGGPGGGDDDDEDDVPEEFRHMLG
ncbi:MAG: peptidase, partial [Planctomycetaceae bacterium]